MPGDSEPAYDFADSKPLRKLSNHEYQLLYYAQEEAIRYVSEADDMLTKHSKSITRQENVPHLSRWGHEYQNRRRAYLPPR